MFHRLNFITFCTKSKLQMSEKFDLHERIHERSRHWEQMCHMQIENELCEDSKVERA